MGDESSTLKESLFNPQTITTFADALKAVYPAFDVGAFITHVFDASWEDRELKDRMRHITSVLHDLLPADYRAALDILQRAAPNVPRGGFIAMVPSDFVGAYGVDDYEASIPALELFTQRVSAEYAVRPFIIRYPDRMMSQMLAWAGHESADVRRLASEGCRPRLPWGIALPALKNDPSPIIPILEKLKKDPSEWVRRSVANNLNDISKDNPDVVIGLLRGWQLEDDSEDMRSLARQALRTLVKEGHPGALELLGFGAAPAISVRNLTVEPAAIPMDGTVTFSFEIECLADQSQDLVIDYVVHLVRARGKSTPKVFKLTQRTIQPGEVIQITKKHSFRAVTTRQYYPGQHAIQPKINGILFDRAEFTVGE
jgi:3-methyladenine DNA glycosylase AlkC